MIEFEDPSVTVEFDFSRSGSALLTQDSNLLKFLKSDTAGEVLVDVDSQ